MSNSQKIFTIDPSQNVLDLVGLFKSGTSTIITGCKLENGNDIGTIFAPLTSTEYKLSFQTQYSSRIDSSIVYTDFTELFAAAKPYTSYNKNSYIKTTDIKTSFFDACIFEYQGDPSSPYNTPEPTPGKCSISFNLGNDTGYMSYLIIGGGGGGAAGKGQAATSLIAGQGGGGGGIIYDNTFNLSITSKANFDIQVGYGGGGGIKDDSENTTFYGGKAGDSYLKYYNRNDTDLYLTAYGGFPGKELNALNAGQGGNVGFTYSTQNSGFINTVVNLTNKIGGGGGGGAGAKNNSIFHTNSSTNGVGGQNANGQPTNAGNPGSIIRGGDSYFVNSNISITVPFINSSSSNDTSFVYGGNGGGGGGYSQGGNQGSTAGGPAGDTTFGVVGARVAENAFSGYTGYTGSGSSRFYYGNGGGGASYLAGNGNGGSGGPGVVMLWWYKSIYTISQTDNIKATQIWSIVNNKEAYNGVIFELSSDSSLGTASIQFTSTVGLSYLIIGGGGGGGQGIKTGTAGTSYYPGLGGGGGGIFYSNDFDLTVNADTTLTIQVGNGGGGSTYMGTSGNYINYLGVSGVESHIKFSTNQLVASGGIRGGGGVNADNNLIKGNGGIATYTGSLSMTNKGGGGGGGGGVQTNVGGVSYANYAGGDGGNYQSGRQGTSGTRTTSTTYQGVTYPFYFYGNGGTSYYNNTTTQIITLPFTYVPNVVNVTTTTNVYCGNGGSGGTIYMGGKAGSTKGGVQDTSSGNSQSLMYGETPYSGYTGSGTPGFYYGHGGGGAASQDFYSRKDYPRYGGNGGSGVVMLWWRKT